MGAKMMLFQDQEKEGGSIYRGFPLYPQALHPLYLIQELFPATVNLTFPPTTIFLLHIRGRTPRRLVVAFIHA